ncbi:MULTISPECIES: CDP-glycerol glycerophosphotransferase family protein [Microbacterium]|uniref:CDP-glycerol glycerophosphotransferase family protein n=1 Tax=Microbacterium TaxID=33882 RepID=UPI00278804DE|nr:MULTISPECIES: CDP-glycerol glycerophosphotransferase family protein [Microbacterium]MDQ1076624.1 CDP-glycerol glycerophosphotransferase (TagB/SpsB family) [Microbacterium sp. SORGH_AS_0969]MDQ1116860.1 CDP-glycerol glycerophosphotransferase (TagB/SpsB family) [Microbacterium testaceum]
MASFSFGAGNARKLRRIPLYLAGRLLTALVPRSRERWVFGCAVGVTDGALALWRLAAERGERALWLVADETQEREAGCLGIPSVRRDSVRGLWATARARVIVVTHGFGDVQRYAVTGAFIVQLWHGIPLKRIGLDSPETTRAGSTRAGSTVVRRVLAVLYRRTTRQISMLPAASHLVRGRLETAFGLPDARLPITGEPRVDVLSQGSADERRHAARAALDEACGRPLGDTRVVLYAPTWRDGEPDPAVPDAEEWDAITAALDRLDATLLIRSHPLGAGDYTPPVSHERVGALGNDRVADITPLLPGIDLLVTDYSSLAFDAALVPLPVLFFAPDLEEYTARRGLYGTYTEVAGTDPARTWTDVLTRAGGILDDPTEAVTASRRRSDTVHAHRDGRNTERVYREIRRRLERAKPTNARWGARRAPR